MSEDATVDPRHEVVVITGAGTAAGRGIARRFARDGAEVAVIGRSRSGMRRCAEEILAVGGDAVVCRCDPTDLDTWVNAAAGALLARGRDRFAQLCDAEERERAGAGTHALRRSSPTGHTPARRARVRVVRVLREDPEATAARAYDAARASRWRRPPWTDLRQSVGGATS